MVTKENVVKVIDFGIARIFKPDSRADTEFLGTRGYAAPEELGVFELGQTDARTDIFIFGTTIKNLLDAINREKKLWLVKRLCLTATTACAIFLATQFISFETPVELPSKEIGASDVNEQSSPQLDTEKKSEPSPPVLNSDIATRSSTSPTTRRLLATQRQGRLSFHRRLDGAFAHRKFHR